MTDSTPPPFTSTRQLLEQASGRDVAALAFGTWQLLANLQDRASHGPRLSGIGSLIDLAGLRWSGLQEDVNEVCLADPQKALLVAEQFALSPLAHFQDWAVQLQTRVTGADTVGLSHRPTPQ